MIFIRAISALAVVAACGWIAPATAQRALDDSGYRSAQDFRAFQAAGSGEEDRPTVMGRLEWLSALRHTAPGLFAAHGEEFEPAQHLPAARARRRGARRGAELGIDRPDPRQQDRERHQARRRPTAAACAASCRIRPTRTRSYVLSSAAWHVEDQPISKRPTRPGRRSRTRRSPPAAARQRSAAIRRPCTSVQAASCSTASRWSAAQCSSPPTAATAGRRSCSFGASGMVSDLKVDTRAAERRGAGGDRRRHLSVRRTAAPAIRQRAERRPGVEPGAHQRRLAGRGRDGRLLQRRPALVPVGRRQQLGCAGGASNLTDGAGRHHAGGGRARRRGGVRVRGSSCDAGCDEKTLLRPWLNGGISAGPRWA